MTHRGPQSKKKAEQSQACQKKIWEGSDAGVEAEA
jgi:hypothetical protein